MPTKRTWRDWAPDAPEPPDLLSRDELVERLAAEGVKASVRDLRNWQVAGAIPYGIRRWDGDAPRAMYPLWMADLVRELRAMQAQGIPLLEIGHRLQANAKTYAARRDASIAGSTPNIGVSVPSGGQRGNLNVQDAGQIGAAESISVVASPAPPPDIPPRLLEWARDHERTFGIKIAHVDVALVDEYGRPLSFQFKT